MTARPPRPPAPWLAALLCLLGFALLAPAHRAQAEKAEELRQAIGAKEEKAQQKKRELSRLTRKERKLYGSLAELEDEIEAMKKKLDAQQQKLDSIKKEEARVQEDYFQLKKEQDKTRERLTVLMQSLWPLHLKSLNAKLQGLSNWGSLNRRFSWLSTLYSRARDEMRRMAEQASRLSANLAEQDRLRRETEDQIASIEQTKDELLAKKLSMLSRIKKVRSLKLSKEEEVDSILSAIHDLNYQLKNLINRRISAHKGYLPWPAKGPVVASFNPHSTPPRRGLGMKLPEKTPVRSVFWGKVVHNDVLRGFGQVVILYHGQDYYSLYAYLADSRVRMGQEVEKDEIIGRAGFYPKADASGLYFELRFHQKPINPSVWLSQ